MEQRTTVSILFALLRCAIDGGKLTQRELAQFDSLEVRELLNLAAEQDVLHLVALGMQENGLMPQARSEMKKHILNAAFRYEKGEFALKNVSKSLEIAEIPFLPLKGAVLRNYYPHGWMRTSCDIDILVHTEDLERAVSSLTDTLGYTLKDRTTHDVLLYSPEGIHLELHFDLVEEGRANDAIEVLQRVWENAAPRENSRFCYEMSDAFFYYYHIAHMAKHFENGGCGIRPFMDLWILDRMENVDISARNRLLAKGRLLQFAEACRGLSRVWFGTEAPDEVALQMEAFLLQGGLYGSADNRVAIQQERKGGRLGYLISRIFVPYERLRRYYPVLEKHPYLMPVMQIRRWFMLLRPSVAKMAKSEIAANNTLDKEKAEQMQAFLARLGLDEK